MRVRLAAGGDACPRLLGDRDSRTRYRPVVAHEVPAEAKRKILDLAHRILGKYEHRVLLRVGGDDVAVVAGQVSRGEVPRERDADRHVLDVVSRAAGHPDDVSLRLPVLVVAENYGQTQMPLYVV